MLQDISLSAPYSGRGGWSWYTGSAGWMYLIIDPASPAIFGDYKANFRYGNSEYEIRIERAPAGRLAELELTVEGARAEGNKIKLENDDRVHLVSVIF